MPAGKKPRFDLNIGFILCHDNPVLEFSYELFVRKRLHTEVTRAGVKKCKKSGFSAAFSVIRVKGFALFLFVGLLQHRHFVYVESAIVKLAGNAYVMPFMPFQCVLVVHIDDALVFFGNEHQL
jgi:hypothetical protein